ncbi:MAG: dUTP diphosphatase, partial [Spirochaetia bacterium]|nr:dUTP diphosphatase [Spirochaetia bacterium]
HLSAPVTIGIGKTAMIPTGLFFEIPEGYEVQVRPRSGLAAKNGITVLNTPGTIDSDYRGEIKVILINLGNKDFVVNDKERIAQMVIAPVIQAGFEITDSLSETERGTGGFGSTGV